jgi:RNA polymerase sigma-70 factor (ECF subfamily)
MHKTALMGTPQMAFRTFALFCNTRIVACDEAFPAEVGACRCDEAWELGEDVMAKQPVHTFANKSSNKREWHERKMPWTTSYRISRVRNLSPTRSPSPTELPFDELLQLCLQSDQDTLWAEFVGRSHSVIAAVVIKTMRRWIRPSPSLIDDLVQETYLKLCLDHFRALRQFVFRHENALFGFLKVVASNVVQDHFRGVYSRKRGSGIADAEFDCTSCASGLTSQFATMERGVLLQAIDRCLKSYAGSTNSARDRAIFWLYYRYGLTAKAISGLPSIKLTVKGVESTLLRLVRHVRLKLNDARETVGNGEHRIEFVGKNVTAKASDFNTVQQLSTNEPQQIQ